MKKHILSALLAIVVMNMSAQTKADSLRADSWSKSVNQSFSLSISYRIGELRASVRKAERSISNDDVKGGGSNNSSSSSGE